MDEYRILEKGEIVQAGDETDQCSDPWRDDAKWEPVHSSNVGKPAPDPAYVSHRLYRRKVTSDARQRAFTRREVASGVTERMTEQHQFKAMLERACVGHGLRIDHQRPGETVMVQIEDDDDSNVWYEVEFVFDESGRLVKTACYRGVEG